MHYQQERTNGCRVSDAWTFRGLRTAILENDLIRVVVLIDKGADIYQFTHKPTDTEMLWRSPWGVRDPRTYLPTTGSPTGLWLDLYEGGWQTVLPAGGYSCVHAGAELGLHAEVNTMPWDAAIVEDTPDRVSLQCWVRGQRMPFSAQKTLTIRAGVPTLEIEETVTNEAEEEMPCVWGQHIALGGGLLDDSCVISLPGGRIINHGEQYHPNNRLKAGYESAWPWTEGKDGSRIDARLIPPKSARFSDQSYIGALKEGWYGLTNKRLKLGFGFIFPEDVFKYIWYWQEFGGGFGYPWFGRNYNVGIEPFTSYPNTGLEAAIKNGTALMFKPGQSVTASMKAVVFQAAGEIAALSPDGTVRPK
jgi:hypothetical protein